MAGNDRLGSNGGAAHGYWTWQHGVLAGCLFGVGASGDEHRRHGQSERSRGEFSDARARASIECTSGAAVSPAMLAWIAAWTAVAALACVQLLRAAGHPHASVRNGYRWFAVAAA